MNKLNKVKLSKLKVLGFGLRWEKINWSQVQLVVSKYQERIYSASKLGRISKVRVLQHRLFDSFYARLLAVRRVTQYNIGKKYSWG